MSAIQSPKPIQLAFFSYAHEDAEFALRLAKDLRAAGAAVWIDRLDIKVGQRWDRAVEEALVKCPQLLVILSPASVDSTNVMDEVSFALDNGKTVLPVIHGQCAIPFRLRRLHYVDLTLSYDEGLGRLLEALGFAAPPSKLPEDPVKRVEQVRAGPSDYDGTPREGNLRKKRVLGLVGGIIGVVAVVLAWGTLTVLKRSEALNLQKLEEQKKRQQLSKPLNEQQAKPLPMGQMWAVYGEKPRVSREWSQRHFDVQGGDKTSVPKPNDIVTAVSYVNGRDEKPVLDNETGDVKVGRSIFDIKPGDKALVLEILDTNPPTDKNAYYFIRLSLLPKQ